MSATLSFDDALQRIGAGAFQRRLLLVFGLVWAADAMQVLSVGFAAPSIAAEFGLSVPQALQVGTLFFAGMLVGATVFGRLADRIGRRRVLLATIAVDAVFGLASAFAPDFGWLLVFRFLAGLGVGGTLPVDYALMAEFLPARGRGRWLVALEGFWAVGTIALALAALLAPVLSEGPAWRTLFLLTALPALIGVLARVWVPESPLFLLRHGRRTEAEAVLARIAQTNGHAGALPALAAPTPAGRASGSIFAPALRRRTALIMLVWLLVSVSYYGVFVWLPVQLGAQGFGFLRGGSFLLLVALAQLPGYALAAYGVERWGRRPTLVGFLVLSAAGCLLYGLDPSVTLVAASTLVMSFALLGTWGALYSWTPELYPTPLRATGMGTAGAVARLGGLLAPSLLAPVATASFAGALALYAALLLAAAVAAGLMGAETRGAALD